MKIFISHSSEDHDIASSLLTLIREVTNLQPSDIYCSSSPEGKTPLSKIWREDIKDRLNKSALTFILVTENYTRNDLCQNELGAAWAISEEKIVSVSPNPATPLGRLLEGRQAAFIDNTQGLDLVKGKLEEHFKHRITDVHWSSTKEAFLHKLKKYSETQVKNKKDRQPNRVSFDASTVDATLSYEESSSNLVLTQKLIKYLEQDTDRPLNLKFNYLGSICASNWLRLSDDIVYGHSSLIDFIGKNMKEISELVEEILQSDLDKSFDKRIDLISLGSGDGEIDRLIIYHLQKEGLLANYYPIDLSIELLQKAVFCVVQDMVFNKKTKIKAIQGDFTKLTSYKQVFGHDKNKNVFSILGLTFGNFAENRLLENIMAGMNTGDLLLVDARLHKLDVTNKEYIKLLTEA